MAGMRTLIGVIAEFSNKFFLTNEKTPNTRISSPFT